MKNKIIKIYKKIQSKIYIKRLLIIISVPISLILLIGLLSNSSEQYIKSFQEKQNQLKTDLEPKKGELDNLIEKLNNINNEYDSLKKELENRPSITPTPEYKIDYISPEVESFGITGFRILKDQTEIMAYDFKKVIAPSPDGLKVIDNFYIMEFNIPGTDCSPVETEQQHLDCIEWFKYLDKECMEYCGIWIYNSENKKLDHVVKLPKIEKGIKYVDFGGYINFEVRNMISIPYLLYNIEKTKDNGYTFKEYYILNLTNYKSKKVTI